MSKKREKNTRVQHLRKSVTVSRLRAPAYDNHGTSFLLGVSKYCEYNWNDKEMFLPKRRKCI